jgi:PilZ domain-containing protein
MTLQSSRQSILTNQVSPRLVLDRRRHKRISVTLLGRFMRSNKREYPCKLVDISVGGAALMSPVEVEDGERIVAYFDHIGGLEGNVARVFEGGFALRLAATQHRREKLAGLLTWMINRSEINQAETRRHERLAAPEERTTLQLDEGVVVPCRVLDISVSGALLATDARPPIGREVVLGKLRARVARYHETGIGVQFVDIQNPAALRRYFT